MDTGDNMPGRRTQETGISTAQHSALAILVAFSAVVVLVAGPAILNLGPVAPAQAQSGATEITNWTDLDNIRNDLGGDYVLMNDLDKSTDGYSQVAGPNANNGSGFDPIGSLGVVNGGNLGVFNGSLNGQGHTISGFAINRSAQSVGLFGAVGTDGTVMNVSISSVRINVTQDNGDVLPLSAQQQPLSIGAVDQIGALIGSSSGKITDISATNITISGTETVGGLIGINGGNMSNVSVTDATVNGSQTVGGIAGTNEGNITNGSVTNATVNGSQAIGGLVGTNTQLQLIGDSEVNIMNSSADGVVTGFESVGGLAGENRGNIVSSTANGTVNGSRNIGGGIGLNTGDVTDSEARGVVTGNEYVGGLVGVTLSLESAGMRSNITGSHASGSVSGVEYVGGLIGGNGVTEFASPGSKINQSSASGIVTTSQSSGTEAIGGLVGESFQGIIMNSNATGDVTAENATDVGGLVGYTGARVIDPTFRTKVSNSFATGEVEGNKNIGGLIGRMNNDTVTNSYAQGNVTGSVNVGGLVGLNSGAEPTGEYTGPTTIRESYATGNVVGGQNTGGLVGTNRNDTIVNAYALGDVSGGTGTGGLVGVNNGTNSEINSSYAAGNVSGTDTSRTGGLVGSNQNGAIVTNSYWDTETTGQANSAGSATGLRTSQMQGVTPTAQGQNTMAGFGFTRDGGDTWVAVVEDGQLSPTPERDGYPILQDLASDTQLDAQEPASPLIKYANSQDIITITGVSDAIRDWQAGEIGISLVSDVIRAWQSGTPLTSSHG